LFDFTLQHDERRVQTEGLLDDSGEENHVLESFERELAFVFGQNIFLFFQETRARERKKR
jgi:hypothetical protein